MKLKLFADSNFSAQDFMPTEILFPFWGKPQESPDDPKSEIFDGYIEIAKSLFEISSLEQADLAVLPVNWEPLMRLAQAESAVQSIKQIKQVNKRSISFFGGDCSHIQLPIETDLVFRNSIYRSFREPNSFVYPAWSEDFVWKYLNNQLPERPKRSKPTIGFCGFAVRRNFRTYAKHFFYKGRKYLLNGKVGIPPYNIGHVLRLWALSRLEKSPLVETNFVQREYPVFFNEPDPVFRRRIRMEYVQNMVESDYILCCRGSGNYSYRFYETLCCGRIPIFIDTDCVLPYDFKVDWKKYCVWLDESEIGSIADKVAEFHDKISPQDFLELQHECRKIWKKWIAPEGFFKNLHQHLSIVDNEKNNITEKMLLKRQ